MNINKITVDSNTHTLRPYGTCATAAGTVAKEVTCSDFTLFTNATIIVKFLDANTASAPTLNVNNTGAKTITGFESSSVLSGLCEFMYDGTSWCLLSTTKSSSSSSTPSDIPTDIDYKNLNSTEYVVMDNSLDERFDEAVALYPQQICIGSPKGLGIAPIANTSTPESTSKPIQGDAIFRPEDIFIYTGTEILSPSDFIPSGTLQSSGYTDRADYTFNTTLPAFHEVYLVCSDWSTEYYNTYSFYSSSATGWYIFLDSSRSSSTIPDDAGFEEYTTPGYSKVYIKIGRSGATENRMELFKEKKVYIYKNHQLFDINTESFLNSKTKFNSVEYKNYVTEGSNIPAVIDSYDLCANFYTDSFIVSLPTTAPINPKKIFFNNGSQYLANSVIAKDKLISSGRINARISTTRPFNSDLPAYHEVYLKGTYSPANGAFQLDTTNTTSWYVFVDSSLINSSEPNIAGWRANFVSGAYYINIGHSGATINDLELYEEKPLLYFNGSYLVDGYTAGLGSTSGGIVATASEFTSVNKYVNYISGNFPIHRNTLCVINGNIRLMPIIISNGVVIPNFNVKEGVFYYTGADVAAGDILPEETLYSSYYIPDTTISFGSTHTIPPNYDVYIEGDYNKDTGLFYPNGPDYLALADYMNPSSYFGNFTAGRYYYKLGRSGKSSSNTLYLSPAQDLYYFTGNLGLIDGWTYTKNA